MNDFKRALQAVIDHTATSPQFGDVHKLATDLLLAHVDLVPRESKKRPFLVVNIEGIDGVGKSTCMNNLSALLKRHDIEALAHRTPTPELLPFRDHFDKQLPEVRSSCTS